MDNEYTTFINIYYPQTRSSIIKKSSDIYHKILETTIFAKAIRPILNDGKGKITLYDNYIVSLNTILLVLPLNDYEVISYKIRISTEYALKYIYSVLYPSITLEKIIREQYRFLNEKLKVYQNESLSFSNLFSIFGSNSNVVHTKIGENDSYNFLVDIINGKSINYKTIKNDINVLTYETFKNLITLKDFKYSDLSQTSKSIIKSIPDYVNLPVYELMK